MTVSIPPTSMGVASALDEMVRAGAVLTIDLDAIRANYRLLCGKSQSARCAAVVKANAYGLGADRVGPALAEAGCRQFFVAHLDEGIALRRHLPEPCEIFVLHGAPPGAESALLAAHLIPVLNSLGQVTAWSSLAKRQGMALPAIIQVDTGMARAGLSPEELGIVADDPAKLDGIALKMVMSHLSWAELPEHPANRNALERFIAARQMLPAAPACLANSAGVFLGAAYHFDLLRPGAALYGLAPQANQPNPMRPVVRLQTKIMQTRTIHSGTPVGYNGRYVAHSSRRIATCAVGYADGFLRCLGNKAIAVSHGVPLPVVGAVSMDMITLDVTDLPEIYQAPGALVDLIGGEAESPDALARKAGTIGYEILTGLGARYHRFYIDSATGSPLSH